MYFKYILVQLFFSTGVIFPGIDFQI